jgi:hypothetical protein
MVLTASIMLSVGQQRRIDRKFGRNIRPSRNLDPFRGVVGPDIRRQKHFIILAREEEPRKRRDVPEYGAGGIAPSANRPYHR